jgi:hypothetical protein
LEVPPELEAKLTRLAAETGRTADQVAIGLLASSVDHHQWFRGEVEKGRAPRLSKPWTPGRVRGTRELVLTRPFLAVYEVREEEVQILRILHGARQWPPS